MSFSSCYPVPQDGIGSKQSDKLRRSGRSPSYADRGNRGLDKRLNSDFRGRLTVTLI